MEVNRHQLNEKMSISEGVYYQDIVEGRREPLGLRV